MSLIPLAAGLPLRARAVAFVPADTASFSPLSRAALRTPLVALEQALASSYPRPDLKLSNHHSPPEPRPPWLSSSKRSILAMAKYVQSSLATGIDDFRINK